MEGRAYSWGTEALSHLRPLHAAPAETLEGPEESSNWEQEEALSVTGSKHHVLGEETEAQVQMRPAPRSTGYRCHCWDWNQTSQLLVRPYSCSPDMHTSPSWAAPAQTPLLVVGP